MLIKYGNAAAGGGGGSNVGTHCWARYEGRPELPVGYTRLAYIQSNASHYINTGIVPNANTKVQGDIEWTYVGCVYGTDTGWVSNAFGFYVQQSNTLVTYGSQTYSPAKPSGKVSIKHDRNSFYLNGSLVKTFDPATVNGNLPLFLFATDSSGSAIDYGSARIYSGFEIYQDGSTLSRRFIACLDTSKVACLYDTVSKTPFYNQGSGLFIEGPEEEDTGMTLVGYVVSDDPDAYPNGDTAADGYYYENIGNAVDAAAEMEAALNLLGVQTREEE